MTRLLACPPEVHDAIAADDARWYAEMRNIRVVDFCGERLEMAEHECRSTWTRPVREEEQRL